MKLFAHLPAHLRNAAHLSATPPATRPSNATATTPPARPARDAAAADKQQKRMRNVSDTIEQALSAAGLMARAPGRPAAGAPDLPVWPLAARGGVTGNQRRADNAPAEGTPVHARPAHASPAGSSPADSRPADSRPADRRPADSRIPRGRPGEFTSHVFSNSVGSRSYKLYVPADHAVDRAGSAPLVVMLHGCTQSPDDFAAGTGMNALADEHGFLVVYPAQAANANGSKCWNWFRAQDQGRDRGEPALIAGITREVADSHGVDGRRIFVAGLSAGAAMAVILGTTYPELYAAVGAHSGLPYGAARDVMSAFGAMKGGSSAPAAPQGSAAVPTIVFHGDSDTTVDPRNGATIVEHALRLDAGEPGLRASARDGAVEGGRRYRHTVHADDAGLAVVEQWLVHGAGHAWSGGSPSGSYTDALGPDASAEMVRFFLSQPRAGSA